MAANPHDDTDADRPTTVAADEGLLGPLGEPDPSGPAEGPEGQFQAAGDGDIRCLTCHQLFPGSSQSADDARRVEGASDPGDMALITRVACPHCGAAGPLVVRYGPEASAEEADLLVALRRSSRSG